MRYAAQVEASQLAEHAAMLAAQLEEAQRQAAAARSEASATRSRNVLVEKAWNLALKDLKSLQVRAAPRRAALWSSLCCAARGLSIGPAKLCQAPSRLPCP